MAFLRGHAALFILLAIGYLSQSNFDFGESLLNQFDNIVTSLAQSQGITGEEWEAKLVHAQYDDSGKIFSRIEFYDMLPIYDLTCSSYSVADYHRLSKRITKVRVFTVPFSPMNRIELGKELLTHHFVGIETKTGFHFTAEKGRDCILIQVYVTINGRKIWVVISLFFRCDKAPL